MSNVQHFELDTIEVRVAELERQILARRDYSNVYTPVVDSLSSSNSLLLGIISSREKIAVAMKRLKELLKYIDSAYEVVAPADTEAMYELVSLYEPVLRNNLELLQQVNELSPVLSSEHMKHVPELSQRLEKMQLLNVKFEETTNKQCAEFNKFSAQYNSIITQLSNALVRMDEIVTACELESKPKKADD